jgi:hypothetical protein
VTSLMEFLLASENKFKQVKHRGTEITEESSRTL